MSAYRRIRACVHTHVYTHTHPFSLERNVTFCQCKANYKVYSQRESYLLLITIWPGFPSYLLACRTLSFTTYPSSCLTTQRPQALLLVGTLEAGKTLILERGKPRIPKGNKGNTR